MKEAWRSIRWWELRRVPFNFLLAVVGAGSMSVFIGGLVFRDADVPIGALWLGVFGYAVAANLGYTLGWISEILWAGGDYTRTAGLRFRIFRIGLLFSVMLTLLPGVIGLALRLL